MHNRRLLWHSRAPKRQNVRASVKLMTSVSRALGAGRMPGWVLHRLTRLTRPRGALPGSPDLDPRLQFAQARRTRFSRVSRPGWAAPPQPSSRFPGGSSRKRIAQPPQSSTSLCGILSTQCKAYNNMDNKASTSSITGTTWHAWSFVRECCKACDTLLALLALGIRQLSGSLASPVEGPGPGGEWAWQAGRARVDKTRAGRLFGISFVPFHLTHGFPLRPAHCLRQPAMPRSLGTRLPAGCSGQWNRTLFDRTGNCPTRELAIWHKRTVYNSATDIWVPNRLLCVVPWCVPCLPLVVNPWHLTTR